MTITLKTQIEYHFIPTIQFVDGFYLPIVISMMDKQVTGRQVWDQPCAAPAIALQFAEVYAAGEKELCRRSIEATIQRLRNIY